MKKLIPFAAMLLSVALFSSCDKGDDNPYGDWKCTCFVVHPGPGGSTFYDTDTIVLEQNDMDRNTAKAFCENARTGYTDTLTATVATCTIK